MGTATDHERDWAASMRAANAGDRAAYARLLAAFTPYMRAFARRSLAHTRLEGDIEDVVQETLMAIHLKRHTWDEARPIGPWVRAVIRHKLVDAARRRGFRTEVAVEDYADVLAAPTPDPERSTTGVTRYLDKLPARQRDVVRALTLDGASVRRRRSA